MVLLFPGGILHTDLKSAESSGYGFWRPQLMAAYCFCATSGLSRLSNSKALPKSSICCATCPFRSKRPDLKNTCPMPKGSTRVIFDEVCAVVSLLLIRKNKYPVDGSPQAWSLFTPHFIIIGGGLGAGRGQKSFVSTLIFERFPICLEGVCPYLSARVGRGSGMWAGRWRECLHMQLFYDEWPGT
jgi:hypothetical protein